MKNTLLLLASLALLLAGCAKEQNVLNVAGDGEQKVNFTVGVESTATKAVDDKDGIAASINHWIMQVLDSDGIVYNYQQKNGTTGLTQTFDVTLVKGQTYQVLFWADHITYVDGGDDIRHYDTESLTNVKLINATTYVANLDERDAFSAVVKDFSTTKATQQNITLKRPFAQLNVVFTDLDKLYNTMNNADEYEKFKPVVFVAKAKVPTTFNVLTQEAGAPAETALEMKAEECYNPSGEEGQDNYTTHARKATLYMDYILTSKSAKDVVDVDFSFVSKGSAIAHNFTSIPFQRNYRTNILGEFMSAGATWTLKVDPLWDSLENGSKDINVDYTEVTPPYVEIGGVKWATMNLGATTVAGSLATCAGDYYQWGSVNTLYNEIPWGTWSGKGHLAITSWKDGKSGGFINDNREYTGIDSVLPDANDVVKQKVGNGWRMPTSDNFNALYDACINGEYDKTKYASTACGNATDFVKGIYWCGNYDGVAGCLFCDGTNKLFFPASGMGSSSSSVGQINTPNVGGLYCSSTFANKGKKGSVDTVYCLNFAQGVVKTTAEGQVQSGFSIRPVKD